MIVAFSLGLLIGAVAVVWLLRLTARTEPTGCLVAFGIILSLLYLLLVIVIRWGLAG